MQLVFKPLGEDVNLIKDYIEQTEINFCDISLGVKYMWRDTVKVEYAIFNNTLILKETGGSHENSFYYPMGEAPLEAIEKIEEYARAENIPLLFGYLDQEKVAFFENRYYITKNRFDRDWCDYIYLKENFITYAGKKLSGQRNHVNKFKKNYPDYKFYKITEENLSRAIEFLVSHNKKQQKAGKIEELEREHALTLTKNMFSLNQRGGFLEVDGEIVALSVGEKVNDTLIVHVEKANTDYVGVYPTMAQEFAKEYANDVKKINREEDCGDLGLRTSKSQYQPLEIKAKNFLSVGTVFDNIKDDVKITTKRLTIERILESDKEKYAKLYLDENINKLWGYDYKNDLGEEEPTPDYFFRFQQSLFEKKEECSFAVKLNGELIGELVLHNFDYFGGLEMGFRFFPEYQNQGFAFESASALREYAKKSLFAKTLKGSCYKENLPSRKLIEKLGMKVEKETDEKFYFKLTLN